MNLFKHKINHILSASIVLTSFSFVGLNPVKASPLVEKHYALELGGGMNTLSPYGGAKFHYTPSSSPFSWFAGIQAGPVFSPTPSDKVAFLGSTGGQFYFLREGVFQPFIGGSLGISSSGTPRQAPLPNGRLGTIYDPAFFGLVALGSDFMFSETFGLSFQVSSDLGFLSNNVMSGTLRVRPELNLKWKW